MPEAAKQPQNIIHWRNGMKYALLIYGNEQRAQKMTEADNERIMMGHFAFMEALGKANANLGGEALEPTHTATSVKHNGGKPVTTDGPFAETKEQLGGFYLINAETLDEAIEWAKQLAAIADDTVEVRPVWDTSNLAPSDAAGGAQQASA
jgi:hypothetical protein